MPPANAVAVAGEEHRDERRTAEQAPEDDADLRPGAAGPLERDADDDAAEPVDERAGRLDGQQAPGVPAQERPASSSRRHQAYSAS